MFNGGGSNVGVRWVLLFVLLSDTSVVSAQNRNTIYLDVQDEFRAWERYESTYHDSSCCFLLPFVLFFAISVKRESI